MTSQINQDDLLSKSDFGDILQGHAFILKSGSMSHSQLSQDAWIVGLMQGRKGGRYLEIGAYDPYEYSNSAVLREKFDWTGFHVDPSPTSHSRFNIAGLDNWFIRAGVGKETGLGRLIGDGAFAQLVAVPECSNSPSTTPACSDDLVAIMTPGDLLRRVGEVDYLSLDIEGGEIDVLRNWPFELCKPYVMTIEHNHRETDRKEITQICTAQGYRQVLAAATDFESWFLLDSEIGPTAL